MEAYLSILKVSLVFVHALHFGSKDGIMLSFLIAVYTTGIMLAKSVIVLKLNIMTCLDI